MIRRRFLFISKFYLAGLLLLAMSVILRAQDLLPVDSVTVSDTPDSLLVDESITEVQDSIPPKRFLSGAELRIDYGKLLLLWTEFESKYEVGINVRFYERIVLATEIGNATLNPLKAYDNALYYQIEGIYGRIGLDYYMAYDPSNFYYAGLRYGMSIFSDEGVFLIDSEFWPDYQDGFGSEDVPASWIELIIGTETYLKVGKMAKETGKSRWLLGWNGRIKILTAFENREEPRIYSIPGYGRTFNNYAVALNFYIKYRIGN